MDCFRVKSIFSFIFCSTPRIEHRNFVVFNDPYPVKPLTHLTFLSFSCERPDPVHRGEGATTTFHILVRDLVKAEIQPDVHIILVVVIFIIFVIIVIFQVIVTQVIRLSAQQVRIVKNLLLLYSLAWQLCKIYNHLLMFLVRGCRWVLCVLCSSLRAYVAECWCFVCGRWREENHPPFPLNTSQMHASLQEEYNSAEWQRALQERRRSKSSSWALYEMSVWPPALANP